MQELAGRNLFVEYKEHSRVMIAVKQKKVWEVFHSFTSFYIEGGLCCIKHNEVIMQCKRSLKLSN